MTDTLTKTTDIESETFWTKWNMEIQFVVCLAGIYIFYMWYAILQELITCTPYDGEKFGDILFLLFVQCVSNTIAAAFAILVTKQETFFKARTHQTFFLMAITYLGGMQSSYYALNFVTFPTTVLAKSGKMIPMMLMGTLIYGKSWKLKEYLCMVAIIAGIFLFMNANYHGGKGASQNSTLGLFMIGASLFFDGITGALQDKMYTRVKPSTHQLMFSLNFYASIQLLIAILVTGEGAHAVGFFTRHPEVLTHLLVFCVVSAIGQNFIFYSISLFGAVACSVITTTRKFFTILCSIIWFGHPINFYHIAGVALVFFGLGYDTYIKYTSPKPKIPTKKD